MAISVEEARAMTEEQLQETITEIAFEIIANVGTARGMYIEAIQEAKAGHFDQAEQLMKDGKEAFVQGHHGHADLLEWQGQGLTWKTNIFLNNPLVDTFKFEKTIIAPRLVLRLIIRFPPYLKAKTR